MALIHSFAPVADIDAQVLILGTMPGPRSLALGEYYAHPGNTFWRIMGELFGFDPASPYASRVCALGSARVAVWDVLRSCVREGALDANILGAGLVANDFREFFQCHTRIHSVYFNGSTAEALYRRYVLPQLGATPLACLRLPSTSPAHASASYERKLQAWRVVGQGAAGRKPI